MHHIVPKLGPSTPMPGPPKLRSSCDRCGIAKVKCDRERPECGRCMSHGVPCVYGVSRKMGKPPRHPDPSWTPNNTLVTNQNSSNTTTNSSSSGGVMLDLESSSSNVPDANTWDPMDFDNNGDGITGLLDAGDALIHDSSMITFPNSSLEFNEWVTTDQSGLNPFPSNFLPSLSPLNSGSDSSTGVSRLSSDDGTQTAASSITLESTNSHNCLRKSHEILESLSVLNAQTQNEVSAPTISDQTVPLDMVLQITRRATERLEPLFDCSCAKSPHVALLYASIISRILAWYQQAAICTKAAATASISKAAELSLGSSRDGSNLSSSSNPPPGITVAPSEMAIGTFKVDDLHLQTAMKIRLLYGEMNKVRSLIEQLGSQIEDLISDESASGDIDNLYQSLDSWLKRDHSRILNMMQSELKELNI